jgi:hypothetical protein
LTVHDYGLVYFQIKNKFESIRRIDEINLYKDVFENRGNLNITKFIRHETFLQLIAFSGICAHSS